MVLDPLKLSYRAVRVEQPFGGGFGCQVDGHVYALRLSKIAVNRILLKTGPLCPQSLRRIPEEGGFDWRRASGPVLGNSWQRAVTRSAIMVRASILPGPHGEVSPRFGWHTGEPVQPRVSIRLRNLSFASALDAPIRVAKRSNFAASVKVACSASSRVRINPWRSIVWGTPPSIRIRLPL